MAAWMIPAALGIASFLGGERRNESQTKQSAKQMAFQREMSNTAHQRQISDLKAAGLNPILSAKYGGASTPAGAMAQIQDTVTPAINTGLQTLQTETQANKTEQETEKLVHETANAFTEYFRNKNTAPFEIVRKKWEAISAELDMEQKKVLLKMVKEEFKSAERMGKIAGSEAGQILKWISEIVNAVSPFTGSAPQWRPRK